MLWNMLLTVQLFGSIHELVIMSTPLLYKHNFLPTYESYTCPVILSFSVISLFTFFFCGCKAWASASVFCVWKSVFPFSTFVDFCYNRSGRPGRPISRHFYTFSWQVAYHLQLLVSGLFVSFRLVLFCFILTESFEVFMPVYLKNT